MQQLAEGLANERSGLEKQWDRGDNASRRFWCQLRGLQENLREICSAETQPDRPSIIKVTKPTISDPLVKQRVDTSPVNY
jgi:hypothetical protein